MVVGVEARVAQFRECEWTRCATEILAALSALDCLELRVLTPDNEIAVQTDGTTGRAFEHVPASTGRRRSGHARWNRGWGVSICATL